MGIQKIKEKPSVSNSAKEKIQAAPKELLRRGLLTGTEKLNGQLRDAAEGGQREETEIERAQNSARTTTQKAVNQMKKTAQKKARNGRLETHKDTGRIRSDVSTPVIQTEQAEPSVNAESVQSKTKGTVRRAPSAEHRHTDSTRFEASQIKTKDARIQSQTVNPNQKSAATSAAPSKGQTYHISQQGRQKLVRERQKNAAEQRVEKQRGQEQTTAARQQNTGDVRPRHSTTQSAQSGKRPAGNVVRKTVSNGKQRIKEARSGAKAVGRTSRQAVKTAESSGKALRAGGRSAQTMRQTARAAVQAKQQVIQAAGATRRTAATVGRPMARAAAAALRRTVSAIRTLIIPLAGGGGAVFAMVLVMCLVGAILASPLGIFFALFGGDSGGGQQQDITTVSTVVQELNQQYDARLDEIRANASYDVESLNGSRAPWPEILAVYAVKTASDPANGQEVVTMTDEKKALLEQVFWDMNQISSFTSTVPGEGGGESTTTLYISVTAKTADEMAGIYDFNDDQRQQLAELLSDEYREMWNGVV